MGPANILNDCENRLAFLAANRIAKNTAEDDSVELKEIRKIDKAMTATGLQIVCPATS
jgi:hypothetical protein